MLIAKRTLSFMLVTMLAAFGACSSSRTDCLCSFDNGDQQRTLTCGEHACVGGVNVSCAAKSELVTGGDCTAPADTSGSDDGGVISDEPPPDDSSCDDLLAFCSSSCNSPPDVAADCLTTGSSGEPDLCSEWSVANGALCSP